MSNDVSVVLPKIGDPLILPDGREVLPDPIESTIDQARVAIQSIEPHEFRASVVRSMRDLPASDMDLRVIAYIFTLTMLGVGDSETAESINCGIHDVKEFRNHELYAQIFDAVANEFINVNSSLLQSRVAAYSHDALSSLAQVALHSNNDKVRGQYSADLLNRAGVTAKNAEAQQQSSANELRIIVSKDDNEDKINLELNGEEV